jgi:mitogen-activated protein kinase 1/3
VYQHDPEDEPVVTPLSPSYFEFDRQFIPIFIIYMPATENILPKPVHKDDLSKDQLKGKVLHSLCCLCLFINCAELLYEEVLSFVPSI